MQFVQLPQLSNWRYFPADMPVHIVQTAFQQELIQFFIAVYPGNGREKVALGIAHVAFHTPFFMALCGCTVSTIEEVIAAKRFEGFLFLPVMPFQNLEYSCFEVVVSYPVWDPSVKVEPRLVCF